MRYRREWVSTDITCPSCGQWGSVLVQNCLGDFDYGPGFHCQNCTINFTLQLGRENPLDDQDKIIPRDQPKLASKDML